VVSGLESLEIVGLEVMVEGVSELSVFRKLQIVGAATLKIKLKLKECD